jgi:hypothetical protein
MGNLLMIFKPIPPPQDIAQGFVLPSNHPLVEIELVNFSSCEAITEPIETIFPWDLPTLSPTIGEEHEII